MNNNSLSYMKVLSDSAISSLSVRVKWNYPQKVSYPAKYKKFLWDHPGRKAPLEKVIVRIFTYGNFADIRWLFDTYPAEAYAVSCNYPDIKRGVKFWMKHWHGQRV